jgi:hypothetical protein
VTFAALTVVGAILIGVLVGSGWTVFLALPAAAGLFLIARTEVRLAILWALVYYPFTLGSLGPVPEVLFAEVAVLLALPFVALLGMRSGFQMLPKDSRILAAAALLLGAVTMVHFAAGGWMGAGIGSLGSSGLRPFLQVAVGLALFFEAMWLLQFLELEKASVTRFLWWLLAISLGLLGLRVASYLGEFDTPLVAGTFDYGVETVVSTAVTAARIGGFAEAAGLGLAALGGLWVLGAVRGRTTAALLLVLGAGVLFSGGRSFAVGVLIAAGLAVIVAQRGRRLIVAVSFLVASLAVGFVAGAYGLLGQVGRLLSVGTGLAVADPARYTIMGYMWRYFLENPILGKGIGTSTASLVDEFVVAQTTAGGHSSYWSMLGNFGIAGVVFLGIFLVVPLVGSFIRLRRARRSDASLGPAEGLLMVVLILGAIRTAEYVVSGNGYSDPRLYLSAALYIRACIPAEPGID